MIRFSGCVVPGRTATTFTTSTSRKIRPCFFTFQDSNDTSRRGLKDFELIVNPAPRRADAGIGQTGIGEIAAGSESCQPLHRFRDAFFGDFADDFLNGGIGLSELRHHGLRQSPARKTTTRRGKRAITLLSGIEIAGNKMAPGLKQTGGQKSYARSNLV